MEELTEGKIKRLRNLKLYAGHTDEEITAMYNASVETRVNNPKRGTFEARQKEKLESLQDEFGLDMNNSNDVEMLNGLVRHLMQAEDVDIEIRSILDKDTRTREDIGMLKALGEFQRDLQISISDLQEKLGITRKLRKDRQQDTVPQFIDSLLAKAANFWERKTEKVICPNCSIELARYWLNFVETPTLLTATIQCPHCKETVHYNR